MPSSKPAVLIGLIGPAYALLAEAVGFFVAFGLILTIFSSIIGMAAGAVQGYFGGRTDLIFQRVIEIWTSVPSLYLLLIISSVLVPGRTATVRA